MAITVLASDEVEYPSSGTSATFTLPLTGKGVVAGDFIICFLTTNSTVNTELTLPDDTTSLRSMNSSGAGVSCGVYLYQAPASVPASISFGWGTARRGTLAWVHVRGDTPLVNNGFLASAWLGASSASHPVPQVTTTASQSLLLTGLAYGSGSDTPTLPAGGWTRRTDAQEREGSIASLPHNTAGTTPAGDWTSNNGTYQSQRWTLAIAEQSNVPQPLVAVRTTDTYPGFTGDVADGAAIIPNPSSPEDSVVIGTNKDVGGGLYVFDLDGNILSSSLPGAANSVDWRDLTGVSGWDNRLLVYTCDRDNDLLRYYWFDRGTKTLTAAGTHSLGFEPYGTCLYVHSTGQVYAFVTERGPDDISPRNMYQYPISRSGSSVVTGSVARTVSIASVAEGMAADDATGYLFVSQEDVGLYRYSASPSGGSSRVAVDTVGAGNLVADVEDVAIAESPNGKWLLVSSQGDSSYHVYDFDTFTHVTRFTAMRPGGSDQVTSTDGLDVCLTYLGPDFPNGLIVVHDGDQAPISDFAFLDAEDVFGTLPDDAEGSATLGFSFGLSASGERTPEGEATLGFSFGLDAEGERSPEGEATLGFTFGVTATGQRDPIGDASLGFEFGLDAEGEAPSGGRATLGFTFDLDAQGETAPQGEATLGFTFSLDASGERDSLGGATLPFAFGLDAEGAAESGGTAALGFAFALGAEGEFAPEGSATLGHAWAIDAEGVTDRQGEATLGFEFGISATGAKDGGGSATFGHQWSLDASGETDPQGEATLGFSFGLGAQGEHDAQGSASLGFSFGIVAEGAREPKGLAILGFEFGVDAQGDAPEPDMPEGSATFGHQWSLQADGENHYSGAAALSFAFGLYAQGPQSDVDLPDTLTLTVVEDILTLRALIPGDPMACVDTMHEKRGDTRTRELVLNRDLTGVTPSDIKVFIAYRGTLVETLTPTIVDAANGIIAITMSGDLEVAAYKLEVQVTQGSSVTTHPTDGWISLIITQDLAD